MEDMEPQRRRRERRAGDVAMASLRRRAGDVAKASLRRRAGDVAMASLRRPWIQVFVPFLILPLRRKGTT